MIYVVYRLDTKLVPLQSVEYTSAWSQLSMFFVSHGHGLLASQSSPLVVGTVHCFKLFGSDGHDSEGTALYQHFSRNIFAFLGNCIFLQELSNLNKFILPLTA